MHDIIVIHRANRREPWNGLRLCRQTFASETEAEEYGWRRARAGALMLRRFGREWRGRFPCRHCSRGRGGNHGACREWKPLTAFRCVQGDPWGEHTVGLPLDILAIVCGPLPAPVFAAEGGFQERN